ncbi:MAG: hypothetical protein GTO02_10525 [Candidatus Dadabacteria bacterium]|nr:hypothetical protein [Candidatus Dadabacteria bacterium]
MIKISEDEYEEVEYEEVEVVDFKMVGIVAVIILAIATVAAVFVFGFVDFEPPKVPFDPTINQDNPVEEIIETVSEPDIQEIPEQIIETIIDPFDHKQDTPPENNLTVKERLLAEYVGFGLPEQDVAFILNDDCINYVNGTQNLDARYLDPQFELLLVSKSELCGVPLD